MKALMIIYNQSLSEIVDYILDEHSVRGYTKWIDVQGRGSVNGQPHLGTHAWPSKNMVILAIVTQEQLEAVLPRLQEVSDAADKQGMRAFAWDAESVVN